MAAFKDMKTPQEVKQYLLNVLSRTGGKNKDTVCLYHYSSIGSLLSMLNSGYIWLGSTESMNDYLENEFIHSVEGKNRLYFSCFSRAEENLAMFKMYAPSPDGAMLALPFSTAQSVIDSLQAAAGRKIVKIVRDNKLTSETVEADVYWAAVAYKDLHTDLLKAETVVNTHILNPINNPVLAGFVKLYGWEYEKEVRLCASTVVPLNKNEKIAIELPERIEKQISIITGPGFNKAGNKKYISKLKRMGVNIHDSEYDALVDLGPSVHGIDKNLYSQLAFEKLSEEELLSINNFLTKAVVKKVHSKVNNELDELTGFISGKHWENITSPTYLETYNREVILTLNNRDIEVTTYTTIKYHNSKDVEDRWFRIGPLFTTEKEANSFIVTELRYNGKSKKKEYDEWIKNNNQKTVESEYNDNMFVLSPCWKINIGAAGSHSISYTTKYHTKYSMFFQAAELAFNCRSFKITAEIRDERFEEYRKPTYILKWEVHSSNEICAKILREKSNENTNLFRFEQDIGWIPKGTGYVFTLNTK